MAIVVNEHEFTVFMSQHPFDTKWLGTQYTLTGKKPLPIKTQLGTDVVIIYSDTRAYIRGKSFFLEEIFRNHEIGVYVDIDDESAVSPSAIAFQYELRKNMKK
jgi:hypothetical protein